MGEGKGRGRGMDGKLVDWLLVESAEETGATKWTKSKDDQ